jgi:prepilin-type N-terminal cleavage/methylation domain-containing protein
VNQQVCRCGLGTVGENTILIRNPHPAIHSCEGFTLLELLLAITVLGILGAIVSLQLAPFFARAHLNNGVRQVFTDLQLVRMKAISQNSRFRVTFRPSTHDYLVEKDMGGTWQPQVLHSHQAGVIESSSLALPSGVSIAAVNSGGDVIFVPRGHVDGGITITLRSTRGEGTKRVVVNLAGRVRIE